MKIQLQSNFLKLESINNNLNKSLLEIEIQNIHNALIYKLVMYLYFIEINVLLERHILLNNVYNIYRYYACKNDASSIILSNISYNILYLRGM